MTLCVTHILIIERVVNNLECGPVALSFQELVHVLFGSAIAVLHNVSMERAQPDFLQENFNIAWRVVVDHLWDGINVNSLFFFIAFGLSHIWDNWINEFSEIFSNRQIDKNVLEKTNEILTCKSADTLKSLKFSQWVHWSFGNLRVLVIFNSWNEGDYIFNLVVMHHLSQERSKWLRGISHNIFNFISQFGIHFSL